MQTRTFIASIPWVSVDGIQFLSALTLHNGVPSVTYRESESGHQMFAPSNYSDYQKAKQHEGIGQWMLAHPDAKLQHVAGNYYYSYTVDGVEKHTRWASTPQLALINAAS